MTNPLILGAVLGAGLDALDSSDVDADTGIGESLIDGAVEGAAAVIGLGLLGAVLDSID